MSGISASTLKKKTLVSASCETCVYMLAASVLEHAPLEAVYIYFDTATYDEIERDEKVTVLTSKGSVYDIVLIKEM